jgi:hypothetical protein
VHGPSRTSGPRTHRLTAGLSPTRTASVARNNCFAALGEVLLSLVHLFCFPISLGALLHLLGRISAVPTACVHRVGALVTSESRACLIERNSLSLRRCCKPNSTESGLPAPQLAASTENVDFDRMTNRAVHATVAAGRMREVPRVEGAKSLFLPLDRCRDDSRSLKNGPNPEFDD